MRVQVALELVSASSDPGDPWWWPTRPAWHSEASCRGVGAAVFFVDRGESTKPAHALCEACPVRAPCAEVGLGERFGIWGGQSEYERRRLRRQVTAGR